MERKTIKTMFELNTVQNYLQSALMMTASSPQLGAEIGVDAAAAAAAVQLAEWGWG